MLRDLLSLNDRKRGKDDKVVIATNIMYVVGQYPRFLNRHWGFLKVVSIKLFEFMHESHEGKASTFCKEHVSLIAFCRCQGHGLRYIHSSSAKLPAPIRDFTAKG